MIVLFENVVEGREADLYIFGFSTDEPDKRSFSFRTRNNNKKNLVCQLRIVWTCLRLGRIEAGERSR